MTTAHKLVLGDGEHPVVLERPRPGQTRSLYAAAQRLTQGKISRPRSSAKEWQADAWDMFDLVGEEHFLVTMLAGRLSQARLYVGELNDDPTQAPVRVEDGPIADAFRAFAPDARPQLLFRLATSLMVAGENWLVGIPRHLTNDDVPEPPPLAPLALDDLDWRSCSVSEVSTTLSGRVQIRIGAETEDTLDVEPEDIMLIRVWRPHPRHWWEADSPARASLPILHELVSLTMHISAQVDSRLAGAGLLLVPSSAARALRVAAGGDPDDESDPFTEALMEAMLTPIRDRSSAAAVVPMVATVPDESIANFRHISFTTPLDGQAQALREEAIRRLALGQDAPPEILLGMGGMSHWGAWLIREDVVSTHLEPPLALICDAVTAEYLHPVLEGMGLDREQIRRYVVWYDVGHLITRPNRFTDAATLHAAKVITDAAFRNAGSFTDTDAPPEESLPIAHQMALDMVQGNPGLIAAPGLATIVEQLTALLAGGPIPPVAVGPPAEPTDEGDPAAAGETPPDEPTPDSSGPGEQKAPSGDLPATEGEPNPDQGGPA
jgi:hypothetical protein